VWTVLLAVCAVKSFVIAFWLQDQSYQRAARVSIIGGLITVGACVANLTGMSVLAVVAAVAGGTIGISSFRLLRVGRG
jgi:uncharacterized protein YcfJ